MLSHVLRRTAWVAGAIIAAALFFLGGAPLRLLMGPISLGPFAGAIEDAVNRSISGMVVRFDQAVIEWSRADGRVELVILGTKVFDLDGRIVAQAPQADLDFDAAGLVSGHLSLKRFSLVGVQLAGVRSADGAIQLGFGPERGESNLLDTIRDILEKAPSGQGSLQSFAIRNARLAFRDEPTQLFLISPDTSFTLTRKGAALNASLDSALEISGAATRLTASAVLNGDGMPEKAHVVIHGLSLPALSANSPAFAVLKPYRLVSDIDADLALGGGGTLSAARFHLAGGGTVDTPKLAFHIAKFDVAGNYDAAKEAVALDALSVNGKEVSLKANGALALAWNGDALSAISGTLAATGVSLAFPSWFERPIALSKVSFTGGYDLNTRKVTVDRFQANGDVLSADLGGNAVFAAGTSPALSLHGMIGALPLADALAYWPAEIAEGARSWVRENLSGGTVGPMRIDADFAPGMLDRSPTPDDALALAFPFEGLTAHYLGDMTPITEGSGEALLTGDSFRAVVTSGRVGPIALSAGNIVIPNLHGAPGHFTVHTDGAVADVLSLIDEEPLGYPKRFGIAPASTQGRAGIDLDFTVPLVRDLALDDIGIKVAAKATGLGLPIDSHRTLEHATVSFDIDPKSLTSEGTGAISSVPVAFKWTEDFAAGDGISTRIDVSGKLDAAARARLGFTDPSWFQGTAPVTLSLAGRRFKFTEGAIKADLTDASASFPIANLEKPVGMAASGSAALKFDDKGAVTASNLAVTGNGFSVRGAVSLDPEGRLVDASLSNVHAGANNDFAARVRPLSGDGVDVAIEGRSIDGTQLFGDGMASSAPDGKAPPPDAKDEPDSPLALSVDVERAVFRDNLVYRNVTLKLGLGAGDRVTEFSLDGAAPTKGRIAGQLTMADGVRKLSLDADDAGTFLRTTTGFQSVNGGTLAARISFPGDAPQASAQKTPPPDYEGTVTLSNFVVVNQPFFARFFAAGSLDGLSRLMQGQGISIDKLNAPFTARGKTVSIHEGRASGPAIGGTFEGMLDRAHDRLDLAGTLVPVYGLNSVLGALPLVGDLLVSKQGEGVFGLTYAMKGKLQEPTVSFNPLSVLTPGILRRIFEFSLPKEPPQQQEQQTPSPPQQQETPPQQQEPKPQAAAEPQAAPSARAAVPAPAQTE